LKRNVLLFGVFSVLFVLGGCRGNAQSADLVSRMKNPDANLVIIDVRTSEEYAAGHIPSAVNIPYERIGETIPPEMKNKTVVVYCRSGRRSSIAFQTLTALGFSDVIDFGAVNNWTGRLVTGENP